MNIDENALEKKQIADAPETETRNQHPDRIKISPEALSRLSLWNEEITGRLRGVKLTRSDLVNFLILNHEQALSSSELKELENRYFDEVKFAQWALEELKAARARGESLSLADILVQNRTSPATKYEPKVRKGKKKDPPVEPTPPTS